MLDICSLLASDGYFNVNKKIMREVGTLPAVLFGELLNKYKYYSDNGMLEDGLFYLTRDKIQEETGMSKDVQRTATNKLIQQGFISVIRKGVPSQNYYKINIDAVIKFFDDKKNAEIPQKSENPTTRSCEIQQQAVGNPDAINKDYIKEKEKQIFNNVKNGFSSEKRKTQPVVREDLMLKFINRIGEQDGLTKEEISLVKETVLYFFNKYESTFGEKHSPILNESNMRNIIHSIAYGTDSLIEKGFNIADIDLWMGLIDGYFSTRLDCDYSIYHF